MNVRTLQVHLRVQPRHVPEQMGRILAVEQVTAQVQPVRSVPRTTNAPQICFVQQLLAYAQLALPHAQILTMQWWLVPMKQHKDAKLLTG